MWSLLFVVPRNWCTDCSKLIIGIFSKINFININRIDVIVFFIAVFWFSILKFRLSSWNSSWKLIADCHKKRMFSLVLESSNDLALDYFSGQFFLKSVRIRNFISKKYINKLAFFQFKNNISFILSFTQKSIRI